ncbi:MAG: DUF2179 domain-containing protein [Bacteroidales bacterium]|jgi:uncharacterized protein YebE (UPF0316 family)|nr:DUF2179 domain-containing protein [Bacteroidales bacterium]
MEFDMFAYVWLPLMIFAARICDVTIGTIRIILVARGQKIVAPLLGFIEVLIWIIAMGQIMENLDNWVTFLFYAAGFATGNYVGMIVEEKIALGIVGLRLVTAQPAAELVTALQENGYGHTRLDAHGATGPVNVLFITVNRKKLKDLITLVNEYNPGAFYTVEDIRLVNRGVFQQNQAGTRLFHRKGK